MVGTQMVTKGLNFENVTLVGVVSADQSLYSGDYRSGERTFSLITQVVGRSGRGQKPGRAIIQTFTPENEIILQAARQDYEAFYHSEIELRKLQNTPPFSQLLSVTVSGLNLLYGPGNDMVAVTNLIASGAQLVLFTTGRGTPYGGVVPTIKIGTNSPISNKKDKWIDFDAEKSSDEEFFALINEVIEGKPAKNELYGYTEISIFKNGVTL